MIIPFLEIIFIPFPYTITGFCLSYGDHYTDGTSQQSSYCGLHPIQYAKSIEPK